MIYYIISYYIISYYHIYIYIYSFLEDTSELGRLLSGLGPGVEESAVDYIVSLVEEEEESHSHSRRLTRACLKFITLTFGALGRNHIASTPSDAIGMRRRRRTVLVCL